MRSLVAVSHMRAHMVPKIFGTLGHCSLGWGVTDLIEARCSSTIVITPNLVGRGSSKHLQMLGSSPFGIAARQTLETRSYRSHMCYPIKFGRCRSNRLGVSTGSQKFWGGWVSPPLGMGAWWLLKTCFSLACLIMPMSVILGQITWATTQRIWLLACWDHSRTVTGTDMDRSATYHFVLVFCSNYGPISYHFSDKGRYLPSTPPLYLMPLVRGFPWNFAMVVGLKIRTTPLPECRQSVTIFV